MGIYIKLTHEEQILVESYAKKHSLSLEEVFKKVFFECVEDEYDMIIDSEALKEYIDSGYKRRPIEELWEELDLC